ncbi:MAG: flagellin [Alphaproteobacteria bacterium]
MANDISLNPSQRNSLLELRDIGSLTARTNERISTGNKVNSVEDDAAAFFKAASLTYRADLFTSKKDEIDQGVSALSASVDALESVNELLETMKGIVASAASQSDAEKISATSQFNEIGNQISNLIEDAYYNGVNLLNSTASSLDISFSDRSESQITIDGSDLNANAPSVASLFEQEAFDDDLNFRGVSAMGVAVQGFSAASTADLTAITNTLDAAASRLSAYANTLGTNVALLESRVDFTQSYVNTLEEGAGKITLADLDEEAANLTALQTRQELTIQSLAISGDMERYTLNLLTE